MKIFRLLLSVASVAMFAIGAHAAAETKSGYSFGVIPQRSPVLTAQFWNPILDYVSRKSGVPLVLTLSRSGPEHSANIGQGRYDFVYSNHNFSADNARTGYRVIARPRDNAIRGQIVVLDSSPLASIGELQDREVAFPSKVAFVGFQVPIDALLRAGLTVKPVFAGNQEGAMGQLKSARVAAAAVNSQVMQEFAGREKVAYRVLWSSEEYLDIPICAHPRVPEQHVQAVRSALQKMEFDPEGARILAASAALIKRPSPWGFMLAEDRDYENQRRFHRTARTLKTD
jgi:phosphonate transport system substrate-binding protein